MIPSERLRELMRRWASGVSLVTARDERGPHGMTVSSFTSLSLDPPLVMVSLERGTRTHAMIEAGGAFAVTILRDDQQDLAERFAGAVPDGDDRFDGVAFDLTPGGQPVPAGGLASFDCRVVAAHRAGTHTIFVGEVHSGQEDSGTPLLYFNRDYRRLQD